MSNTFLGDSVFGDHTDVEFEAEARSLRYAHHAILDGRTVDPHPLPDRITEFAKSGGLLSYGVDMASQFGQAAPYVDRILKGAKAGDLPVQAPTKFELIVNLKTARALGLTVPPLLLATADEVIE